MSNSKKIFNCLTAARTDVGMVREVNEDAFIANPETNLWAVADGMGGHAVGDVASNKIITALEDLNLNENMADYVNDLEECLQSVNLDIIDYAHEHFGDATMGSTFCGLIISGSAAACVWVGDSRLYRLRGNEFKQISKDHSQVQEMLNMGLISQEEVENHPQSNVITRAVGVERELFTEITLFNLEPDDMLMLCSDGLYGVIDEETIKSEMSIDAPNSCVDNLMFKALENGANDNVTIIAIKIA